VQAAAVFGVQVPPSGPVTVPPPQTFATPPPPQIAGGVQAFAPPQIHVPPQPSETTPQFLPAHAAACVAGFYTQFGVPHWFGVPAPPQMLVPVHAPVPHERMPPQPSATSPHSLAPQTVLGMHAPPSGPVTAPPPHLLGMPPPPQI
jgi:hypothetical protein